jgi:hypothetical protein
MASTSIPSRAPSGSLLGRAPIPREHGAWVILYAPLVIAFATAPRFSLLPSLLLVVAVTGAFLARNAAAILIRKRAKEGTALWLGIYLTLCIAGGAPLVLAYERRSLLLIAAAVAGLFGIHAALSLIPSRKRLDRSCAGELLAVAALTSTAPAAYAVSTGAIDGLAWCLWTACLLFFGSGILHVEMHLSAAKVRGEFTQRDRWRCGGASLVYHVALLIGIGLLASRMANQAGALTWLAYLPVILRGVIGWSKLTNKLPSLKRVGIMESAYALWFAALFIAAVRGGS